MGYPWDQDLLYTMSQSLMLDHSRVPHMDRMNQPQQLKSKESCVKANAGELGDHWINNLDTGRVEE